MNKRIIFSILSLTLITATSACSGGGTASNVLPNVSAQSAIVQSQDIPFTGTLRVFDCSGNSILGTMSGDLAYHWVTTGKQIRTVAHANMTFVSDDQSVTGTQHYDLNVTDTLNPDGTLLAETKSQVSSTMNLYGSDGKLLEVVHVFSQYTVSPTGVINLKTNTASSC